MVSVLLSLGASLTLTSPLPNYIGGCTAADVAHGACQFGMAAFLAEKSLIAQLHELGGSLEPADYDVGNRDNSDELQMNLNDAIQASFIAANAQVGIQDKLLKLEDEPVIERGRRLVGYVYNLNDLPSVQQYRRLKIADEATL